MTRVALLAVLGVPAVLMAALIGLEASHHEGYRPDSGDLARAALWAGAVAGAVLGYVVARRPSAVAPLAGAPLAGASLDTAPRAGGGPSFAGFAWRRLAASAGVAALFTVVLLAGNDVVYNWLVPLPGDLVEPVSWWPEAAYPLAAAVLGCGAGLLRTPSAPVARARGRTIAAGVVLALAGVIAVPEYTRIALELATDRFSTDVRAGLGGPPAGLTAGRHALYGYDGSTRGDCPLTDSAGRRIDVSPPAVRYTDNSDSIVSTMIGTFTLDEPTEITGECRSDDYWVAGPPVIKGSLGPALHTSRGVLSVLGALPGVLVIGLFLARVREKSRSSSNPGHQPNG